MYAKIGFWNMLTGMNKSTPWRGWQTMASKLNRTVGSLFCSNQSTPMNPFANIMDMAKQIARLNPAALPILIKALLRPQQAHGMLCAIECWTDSSCRAVSPKNFFMGEKHSALFSEQKTVEPTSSYKVRLASDPVLPCAWRRERIASALANIGTDKRFGPWKQDPNNHHLTLWLPWGIAFVGEGNHSITAGILNGEGEIIPDHVFDMSAIFDRVYCDGDNYFWRDTHKAICEVTVPRTAAVFEIGRLIGSLRATE